MSRLIVKGLPARYDDSKLRNLFMPLGEVTDARVIKTADGRSRCFGFVGFRTKQDANRARSAMHRAYVDTRPVIVEVAHAKGDDAIPRPWSRYSAGSSTFQRSSSDQIKEGHPSTNINTMISSARITNNAGKKENIKRKAKSDSDGEENNKSAKSDQSGVRNVSNEVDMNFSAFEEVVAPRASGATRAALSSMQEKTEVIESKRNGSKGQLVEKKHITFEDDSDNEDDNLYEELPKHVASKQNTSKETDAEHGNQVALNDSISDMDYFKSKMVQQTAVEDDENGDVAVENSDAQKSEGEDEEKEKTEGLQSDTGDDEVESSDGDDSGDANESNVSDPDQKDTTQINEHVSEPDAERIDAGETGRLFIRNLAFSVTEEELEEVFEPFGALLEVHIVRDSSTNQSRGVGFVQYCIPENAAKALMSLDRSYQSGRIMHVIPARPKPTPMGKANGAATKPGSSAFKLEKKDALKESAKTGKDVVSQHTLHLSADAVAEVAASRHGVSKADLFGASRGESGVAAVRLAVAEAAIQGETRAYLLENGINLDRAIKAGEELKASTVAAKKKRMSRTAFLVKNLPAQTSERELRSVFSPYGAITRLVVVPSGLLGVVQYSTASDARRAYNGLAYTRFRDTPLYLEWLPSEALFNVETDSTRDITGPAKDASEPMSSVKAQDEKITAPAEVNNIDEQDLLGSSVYIKNLSFETRDLQLKRHFENVLKKRPGLVKSLRSAKVAMKRGPEGKESEQLSMGFGFLEFVKPEDAREAVKVAQNSTLDGHVLRLQISKRDEESRNVAEKKRKRANSTKTKPGPKLMVRNVAFEATRKDVRQLFEAFGQLKTVRIPRKMDGSHRGFAFVEFASKTEAMAAYEALTSTHLFGRHLVIEYANENDAGALSIAELQEKAARDLISKRQRIFEVPDDQSKHGKQREETDDTAMMRDELYG